ncbi:MAG: endonuclease V [Candidatus Hydrogenedentes bacterium]|nr:endonuclease V [Candidatus Hydrogenedentota bacterium]
MIACLDVDYRPDSAVAACVLLEDWTSPRTFLEILRRLGPAAPYEPGQFYKRELPCLQEVLSYVREPLEAIVIDGYVWLGENQPGLGAHLYSDLGSETPIVGVAKKRFAGAVHAEEIYRGMSRRPLYITAIGVPQGHAAAQIARMHGPHRIPDALQRADRLCRTA